MGLLHFVMERNSDISEEIRLVILMKKKNMLIIVDKILYTLLYHFH